MKTTLLIEEVFKMRFIDAYGQYGKGRLTCDEAAEILGITRIFHKKIGKIS